MSPWGTNEKIKAALQATEAQIQRREEERLRKEAEEKAQETERLRKEAEEKARERQRPAWEAWNRERLARQARAAHESELNIELEAAISRFQRELADERDAMTTALNELRLVAQQIRANEQQTGGGHRLVRATLLDTLYRIVDEVSLLFEREP